MININDVIWAFEQGEKAQENGDSLIAARYYRVAMMAFFCLAIESVADSSYLSGKGMGYFMLIGLCLNANRGLIKFKRPRITKISTDD